MFYSPGKNWLFNSISGYSQMQSSTCGVFHSLTHWLMWKIEKSSNIEVRTSRHWYVWAHIIIMKLFERAIRSMDSWLFKLDLYNFFPFIVYFFWNCTDSQLPIRVSFSIEFSIWFNLNPCICYIMEIHLYYISLSVHLHYRRQIASLLSSLHRCCGVSFNHMTGVITLQHF